MTSTGCPFNVPGLNFHWRKRCCSRGLCVFRLHSLRHDRSLDVASDPQRTVRLTPLACCPSPCACATDLSADHASVDSAELSANRSTHDPAHYAAFHTACHTASL